MQECEAVSIVMCTYNGEKFLIEQIDSIINQTYPIYELIIQDDHQELLSIISTHHDRQHMGHLEKLSATVSFCENIPE